MKGLTNAGGGIPTGGVTTDMLGNASVTTAKVAPNAITRSNLANDALYTPLKTANGELYINSNHIGLMLRPSWDKGLTLIISQENSKDIPNGAEIALIRWGTSRGGDCKIVADGIVLLLTGDDSISRNRTLIVNEPFGIVALKKMASEEARGDSWLATGNVEVVS